jgi:Uma2 family endonuclease
MDPYLERFWNDVHGKLITYIADALNDSLPPRFRATMQERVIISDQEQPLSGARYPDIAVLEAPRFASGGTAVESSHLLIRSPDLMSYAGEPLTEYSVEIIDTKFGEKVVTAIEVLSPENKRPGDGMSQFQRKQSEYRAAHVNRVEIDLLREGQRLFDFPRRLLAPEQNTPYYVAIYRGDKNQQCELYAIGLREPLPVVGVPLRANDPDVPLDLQQLIEHVYRTGRFPIDYDDPCDPPLEGPTAEWAKELLAKRAR